MTKAIFRHAHKLMILAALLVADLLVFGGLDARNVNSLMLIAGFLLLMATLYWCIYGVLTFVKLYGLVIRGRRRLAGSLTGLIGCLVALQSVGELNPRDVLVLLPLVIVGYVYSFYIAAGRRRSES